MSENGSDACRRPWLCLVTPGRTAGDLSVQARAERAVRLTMAAVDAGIGLVQIREPDMPVRLLLDLVRQCVGCSRSSRTRIVVNDRVDVALAAGADGVHLGAHSLPPARVRTIVPDGFVVGCSIHSVEEAQRLTPAEVDYLVAGTVFATPSKPGATALLGTEGLSAIVAAARVPVLAIGGVTLDRLAGVAAAGAAGVAAIGLFADAADLRSVVARAVRLFDTPLRIP